MDSRRDNEGEEEEWAHEHCSSTAASVEVLSQSALTTPDVPALVEHKDVFPHDESDFALIRQHNGGWECGDATRAGCCQPHSRLYGYGYGYDTDAESRRLPGSSSDSSGP